LKNDLLNQAAKYNKIHKHKKRWYRVVTCLAAIVVFCTTYALILPAITLEKDIFCGCKTLTAVLIIHPTQVFFCLLDPVVSLNLNIPSFILRATNNIPCGI